MWNVNSVLMGGLGGDPEETSSDEGIFYYNSHVIASCNEIFIEDEASLAKINEKVSPSLLHCCIVLNSSN